MLHLLIKIPLEAEEVPRLERRAGQCLYPVEAPRGRGDPRRRTRHHLRQVRGEPPQVVLQVWRQHHDFF